MRLLSLKIFSYFLFFLFLNNNAFSQTAADRDEQIRRELEIMMKARDEMLRSLLDDSAFNDFDKRFEDMIKRFNLKDFDLNGFDTDGKILGEYDWQETNIERIFLLKVKQIKDKPLDIKIEKGKIHLKGDVEVSSEENNHSKKRQNSHIHFERSISIPEDVDQTNPSFDNKEGVLYIKFKKLVHTKKKERILNKSKDQLPEKSNDTPRPINKENNDLII
jgi:HSP20 family molecular chaperone IbpA